MNIRLRQRGGAMCRQFLRDLVAGCSTRDDDGLVVVVDSDSTDRTVEIAEDMGVPVVAHPDILPELVKRAKAGG